MLNQFLQLERPLIVFDCETTGLNPEVDRIIQMAVTIHYVDKDPVAWVSFINPEMPIENHALHGITNDMVKDAPPFAFYAEQLAAQFLQADLCGYNVAFDLNFLKAEMKRANIPFDWRGHIVDPLIIYKLKRPHTLSNAFLEFGGHEGNPTDIPFDDAHDASADVTATEHVLRGQLLRYPTLPRTVDKLSEVCFPKNENAIDPDGKFVWAGNDPVFNFGKWRGKSLKDPSTRSYLRWVADKGEFSSEVKTIASNALSNIYPEKP